MSEDGSSVLFGPVQTGRVSDRIAERVKDAIRHGHLPVGERLPSERQLTEQLNVSRVTLRDALRILETRGLIEIRVGAQGGAFVTAPNPGLVAEGVTDLLMLSDLSPVEVTEARQAFELAVIPLACERADDKDIADLREICDRSRSALSKDAYEVDLSAEFHVRLARATHNHAIALMASVLQVPLLTSLKRAQAVAPEMGGRGTREHLQIIDAIEARDVDLAVRVMTTHLERTAQRLRGQGGQDGRTSRRAKKTG